MGKSVLLFTLLFLLVEHLTDGFPSGASVVSCGDLLPRHRSTQSQATPFPYKLTLDKTSVKFGGEIRITLDGAMFKGFMGQVRKIGGGQTPFGVFVPSNGHSKGMKCTHDRDTITQTNNDEKTKVVFSWIAPQDKGKYQIWMTVVKGYTTFWVGHVSETIEVD